MVRCKSTPWTLAPERPSSGPSESQGPIAIMIPPTDNPSHPDISAAKHADLLFVKLKTDGENDLLTYCGQHNIKHLPFTDFSGALTVVQSIVEGRATVDELIGTQ